MAVGRRALACESLEGLEQPLELRGRNRGSGVGNRQDGVRAGRGGANLDAASGLVVADGVVKEIADQPLDQRRVAAGGGLAEGVAEPDLIALGVGSGGPSSAARAATARSTGRRVSSPR